VSTTKDPPADGEPLGIVDLNGPLAMRSSVTRYPASGGAKHWHASSLNAPALVAKSLANLGVILKETGQLDEARRALEASPIAFRNRPDFRLLITDRASPANPFALSNPGIDTCISMTEAPCIAYSRPMAQAPRPMACGILCSKCPSDLRRYGGPTHLGRSDRSRLGQHVEGHAGFKSSRPDKSTKRKSDKLASHQ
jgi:hypothetical protein